MEKSPSPCAYRDFMESSEVSAEVAATDGESVELIEQLESPDPSLFEGSLNGFNMHDSAKEQQYSDSLSEIPEPIKVLDEIISEFEEISKPVVANGENQSEDDGYMSLSRKNMHKKDFEENGATVETPRNYYAELDNTYVGNDDCAKDKGHSADSAAEPNIIQSTLPKARPISTTATNYSSLPCSGVRSATVERNVLGFLDINAVHNAVIQGGFAKLPEPILNEHPVTIYPGRYASPSESRRGHRSNRLLASVEQHKEVCQILNPLSSISSSSASSSSSNSTNLLDSKTEAISVTSNEILSEPNRNYRVKNNLIFLHEDDFSDDLPSLKSIKQNGVAWEIRFKSNKKKLKSPAKRKSLRKNVNSFDSAVTRTEATSLESLDTEGYGLDAAYGGGSYGAAPDHEKDADLPDPEILNYCMYRNANMLGKGTFIIRRATKKPAARAMDIFARSSSNEIVNLHENKIEQSNALPLDNKELYENAKGANSGSLRSFQPCTSLASPRDRLSLNLDSLNTSMLKTEANLVGKKLADDLSCYTKAKSKPDITHDNATTKSINDLKVDEETKCNSLSKGDASHFEAYNVFAYKNGSSNGLKGHEFPELRTPSTTPHTDLAPTLEEEEEQFNEFSYGCAPLQQIESNISALLRGEIPVVRTSENAAAAAIASSKRSLEFRPGVHKSESAKEMLLSQNALGPLPPSPPSSNPDLFDSFKDYDALPPLPPLPPSPKEKRVDELPKPYIKMTAVDVHVQSLPLGEERKRSKDNVSSLRHLKSDLPLPPPPFENLPPAVPPHRGHSANTMKSWSIDSNYKKRSPKMMGYGSGITTPTGSHPPSCEGSYSTKRYISCGTKRSLKQSPREELRLQTSCSLPETPIFARGCDIPRTPFRRQNESSANGSRTAPRSSTSHSINMGTSIVGIAGGNTFNSGMCRQRSINHALASNEMLRLSGVPARGWYPKQRSMRPASTENIDRLTSTRVWDSSTGISNAAHSRKPLTLPPNLTPSFLNKSPREALRRVTSLLITKKKNTKERKVKTYEEIPVDPSYDTPEISNVNAKRSSKFFSLPIGSHTAGIQGKDSARNTCNSNTQKSQTKKKGLFKNLWKKTKHFSLDQ